MLTLSLGAGVWPWPPSTWRGTMVSDAAAAAALFFRNVRRERERVEAMPTCYPHTGATVWLAEPFV
jgi:hypothetical protein